jgi:acyl-CoA synthetase (AMP-forming)/AMP-acid ligase II
MALSVGAAGGERHDKVAHYLYNSPEYLESMFGMFKAGLVPARCPGDGAWMARADQSNEVELPADLSRAGPA